MNKLEIIERKNELLDELNQILENGKTEKRELEINETNRFEEIENEIKQLDEEIRKLDKEVKKKII